MVGRVLSIGPRAQAGYVLRRDTRRVGLVDESRPRRVTRPVGVTGPREVGPCGNKLIGERSFFRVERTRVDAENSTVPVREQELDVDGVRRERDKAWHVREVIRRVLVVEFVLVYRHPFGP